MNSISQEILNELFYILEKIIGAGSINFLKRA